MLGTCALPCTLRSHSSSLVEISVYGSFTQIMQWALSQLAKIDRFHLNLTTCVEFHLVSDDLLQVMEWHPPYLQEQYKIPAELLVEGRVFE